MGSDAALCWSGGKCHQGSSSEARHQGTLAFDTQPALQPRVGPSIVKALGLSTCVWAGDDPSLVEVLPDVL